MTPTISMQTDSTRAAADVMRGFASDSSTYINELTRLSSNLSTGWLGYQAEDFISSLQFICRRLKESSIDLDTLIERLQNEICEWENADKFADPSSSPKQLTGTFIGAAGVAALAGAGNVLGASTETNSGYVENYQKMKWGEKFSEQDKLAQQISDTKNELSGYPEESQIDNNLSTIDKQIAEWESRKKEMEAEERNLFNKIPADFTGESASEIYKKEVERCDQVLANLREQREKFLNLKMDRADCQSRLTDLTNRQDTLQQVIKDGVAPDGPTPSSKRNILGGCTNYVATKRNVEGFFKSGHMNANYWDENARDAGFEVGSEPVKGSIMVFEADDGVDNGIRIVENDAITEKPMNVDNSAGHVAFVENSQKVSGGYNVTISQANTKYDANGNYIPGIYIKQNTMTVFVPDGNEMCSFIYNK